MTKEAVKVTEVSVPKSWKLTHTWACRQAQAREQQPPGECKPKGGPPGPLGVQRAAEHKAQSLRRLHAHVGL